MQVLAVLNTKGGAGKTTLTTCLAVRAAAEMKTVLVDLDPQGSLGIWHSQRMRHRPDEGPELLSGEDRTSDAVKALEKSGAYDLLVVDGPTNALALTEDAIKCAAFVVIPMKASGLDLTASYECIELCQEHKVPFLVVINDKGQHDFKLVDNTRAQLAVWKAPTAKTVIPHRVSYINAFTSGSTGPEKDKKGAGDEIEALWGEIKAALRKAAKARAA